MIMKLLLMMMKKLKGIPDEDEKDSNKVAFCKIGEDEKKILVIWQIFITGALLTAVACLVKPVNIQLL